MEAIQEELLFIHSDMVLVQTELEGHLRNFQDKKA